MDIFKRLMREDGDWNKVIHSEEYNKGFDEGYCKGKKDAAPKWTPVTERLPKNDDWVIISIRDDSGDNVFCRSDFGWYLEEAKCWIVDSEQRRDIIAWMPLPEPFEEVKKWIR